MSDEEAEAQAPPPPRSKPRGAASVPPRTSPLLRWMGRLLIVAICLAGVLAWGFYNAPGLDGQPQRKLPWSDPQGFQAYAQDTLTWARAEGERAAAKAKQKFDEIEWTKESDALWDKANAVLTGSSAGASAGATAAGPSPVTGVAGAVGAGASAGVAAAGSPAPSGAPAARSATAAGAAAAGPGKPPGAAEGDPAMGPGSAPKPGYYEAYKSGYRSYRDGLVHFRNAKASKGRGKELKAALDQFGRASTSWQKALELRERDPNLDELMRDLNQYIFECRKQLKATSY